jgi:hypothetical protein
MTTIGTRALMDDIERDVRNRLRRHILKRGGAPEYEDEALFERVRAVLGRAVDERNADALLLPELLDSDVEWELQTHLRLTTHRPVVGRVILFVKRRLLLPMTRWLFEYSQENFRRQQRINAVLFACIEDLAIENAFAGEQPVRLRQAHHGACPELVEGSFRDFVADSAR